MSRTSETASDEFIPTTCDTDRSRLTFIQYKSVARAAGDAGQVTGVENEERPEGNSEEKRTRNHLKAYRRPGTRVTLEESEMF